MLTRAGKEKRPEELPKKRKEKENLTAELTEAYRSVRPRPPETLKLRYINPSPSASAASTSTADAATQPAGTFGTPQR